MTVLDNSPKQLDAGLIITGFYEDRYGDDAADQLSQYLATFMATRGMNSEVNV